MTDADFWANARLLMEAIDREWGSLDAFQRDLAKRFDQRAATLASAAVTAPVRAIDDPISGTRLSGC